MVGFDVMVREVLRYLCVGFFVDSIAFFEGKTWFWSV